jgi:hypothetical protein
MRWRMSGSICRTSERWIVSSTGSKALRGPVISALDILTSTDTLRQDRLDAFADAVPQVLRRPTLGRACSLLHNARHGRSLVLRRLAPRGFGLDRRLADRLELGTMRRFDLAPRVLEPATRLRLFGIELRAELLASYRRTMHEILALGGRPFGLAATRTPPLGAQF